MRKVLCSPHSEQRFNERITKKSKRFNFFADLAYNFGDGLDDISDKRFRYYIESKEKTHGSVAKVYHGIIYWFRGRILITLYPVPRDFRGNI